MLEVLLPLLWGILCCVLVLGLAYWFTKFVAGRGWLRGGGMGTNAGPKDLRVLSQLSLGRDQRLLVVQAGGRYFLLGVTAGGISCLAEFSAEEADAWQSAQEAAVAEGTPTFTEALQKVLKDKWRR